MRFLLSASLIAVLTGNLMLPSATAAPAPAPEKIVWNQIRDLELGHTLFYFFQRQYFSSIIHLTVSRKKKTIPHHQDEAELLLGGMYLSFGMHKKAGEIFDRLIDAKAPLKTRNRAWFYLAKIRYQRNLYPEAYDAIKRIEGKLPGEQEQEKRLLFADILLAQQKYSEADVYLQESQDKSIWSVYARYNLAVSLIRQGKLARGHEILQAVGKIKAPDSELQSIRDQANLALGYSFIQQQTPDQAITFLRKVRLHGHLSTKALLGLGWAYDQKKQYEKALAPWLELNKRNILDSAVQESFLATAYALGKLKKDALALKHYQTAIEIYEGEIRRIEDTIININDGSYINHVMAMHTANEMGWFWEMKQAPKLPESHYLISLLSSHTFQESLKNYRDLRLLRKNLTTWAHNVAVFNTILETRQQAYAAKLPVIQKNSERFARGDLKQRRDIYANEYKRILLTDDLFALANTKEKKHLQRLKSVKQKLDRIGSQRDMSRAREKYRLLNGAIKWNIASQYGPRTWEIKQGLKQLDKALVKNRKHSESILRAERSAPLRFEGYGKRIEIVQIEITKLTAQTDLALLKQEKLLRDLAIYSLRQQQDRIDAYLTHAQFSVAQIQDRAAHPENKGKQP